MQRADKLKAGKFDVDASLVRRLISRQFPHWAALPVTPVAEDGWDNWTFRLGDTMKVRLPSAPGYAEQAEKEARWLPRLAPHLPVSVPVPLGLGLPDDEYPWHWSIYAWLDGDPAHRKNVAHPVAFAAAVAGFLTALQRIDPAGGPPPGRHNFRRGAPLMSIYGDEARRSVDAIAATIDAEGAHAVLDAAEAAVSTSPPVWVHGDVAIGNLLVRDGRLDSVIDFGCLAVGDPACDLVIAWLFFDGESRAAFRRAVPNDHALWARARGWALWKAALVLASNSPTSPHEHPPRAVLEAVIAEHRALAADPVTPRR